MISKIFSGFSEFASSVRMLTFHYKYCLPNDYRTNRSGQNSTKFDDILQTRNPTIIGSTICI